MVLMDLGGGITGSRSDDLAEAEVMAVLCGNRAAVMVQRLNNAQRRQRCWTEGQMSVGAAGS